ncbi:MAG: hypothetical protein NTU98_01970 [Bacteroidetes bacterium]|nr:hypothetical protein [Bacteroidota bacterium]
MKTTKSIRILLISTISVLLLSFTSFASTPAEECAKKMWQKFQNDVKYPEFAQKLALQGEVIVLYMISEEGRIVVKDIRSTDVDLANYVRKTLTEITCPELKTARGYDFKVKFHFRLI